MAEQTEKDKAEAAAKAAAEQEAKKAEAAAKAAAGKLVLVYDMHGPDGKLLPAGTELDASEPWVKRCVLPYDLAETKAVHLAKKALAAKVAEAEAAGKEALEKAKRGEE